MLLQMSHDNASRIKSGFRCLMLLCGFETHQKTSNPAWHRHPISSSLGTLSALSNTLKLGEWQKKKKKPKMSGICPFLLKNKCTRLCRSHVSVRDYVHICVSYLSRERHSPAEIMMSCGTYPSSTWQAHSEDSSLFTKAPMMTFYWMTCSSICSMRTATACFFSLIISRINSLDRLLASWWMHNCFPVHRLILRCVTRWAPVALQMNQGEQTCLCVKIKRAPRLDNLMPGKLCLTAKVGWLFADFIILLPLQRKRKMNATLSVRKKKCVDLLKMEGENILN